MNWYIISTAAALFINLFLTTFVLTKNYRSQTNILFSLMNLGIVFWIGGDLILAINPQIDKSTIITLDRFCYAGAVFIPSLYLHFLFSVIENSKQKFWLLLLAYILSLVLLIFALFSSLFVKDVIQITGFGYVKLSSTVGTMYYVFYSFLILSILYGSFELLKAHKILTGYKRNQIRYILFATIVALLASSVYILTIFNLKIPSVDNITLIVYAAIVAYAIIAHHLMDIEIVIRKTIFYTLLTAALSIIYFASIFFTEQIFRSALGLSSLWGIVAASFIIILVFQPLWDKIQNLVDTLFFKGKYDYQQALIESSEPLTLLTDLPTLLKLMARIVSRKMLTSGASILIYDENRDEYIIQAGEGTGKQFLGQFFSPSHPLIEYIKVKKKIFAREETQLREIKESLQSLKAALCIPAVWKGKLTGVVFLGEKKSGDTFNSQDISLLTTLAEQGALAVKNATLYDDIRGRAEELRSLFLASKKITLGTDIKLKLFEIINILKESLEFVNACEIEIYAPQLKVKTSEPIEGVAATIPLMVEENKLGHILISATRRQKFSPDEINLVAIFAQQVSASLKVTQLYHGLKETQSKLIESEKMAVIGTLAASIAHEIKNPLTPIKTFVQILGRNINQPGFLEKFDSIVLPEMNRLKTLLANLIDFSKPSPPRFAVRDLNEVLKKQIEKMEEYFKNYEIITVKALGPIPKVLIDEDKIIQATMNILLNGVQAIKEFRGDKKQLTIATRAENNFVILEISDTGGGISAENLENLFKIFFTTKKKGTGLGLYITQKIIRDHRGEIKAASQAGEGTTFSIKLPAAG